MSIFDLLHGDLGLRPHEEERQAPSVIVNACQSVAKWLLALAFFFLPLAASIAWAVREMAESVRLYGLLRKEPPPSTQVMAIAGAIFGALVAVHVILLIRCSLGLRSFAASRKVIDLHSALRRLRTLWRVFSLSLLLIALTVIAGIAISIWGMPKW